MESTCPVEKCWGQAPNFTLLSHLEHSRITKKEQRKPSSTLVWFFFLPSAKSWVYLGYYSKGLTQERCLLNKLLWLKTFEVRLKASFKRCTSGYLSSPSDMICHRGLGCPCHPVIYWGQMCPCLSVGLWLFSSPGASHPP